MRIRNLLFLLLITFAIAVGGVIFGCGEKTPSEEAVEAADHGHEHEEEIEEIPQGIMDSLRAKKKRYRITLDKYWDDRGGTLGNEFLKVSYPPGLSSVTHGMYAFEQIVFARRKCRDFFGEVPRSKLKVFCSKDLQTYKEKTNREWWYYSEMREDRIRYQPIYILAQRGLAEIAIPHEYYQWAIKQFSKEKAPRWLEEGLASYLSDEKDLLKEQLKELADQKLDITPAEVEEVLQQELEKDLSRIAYYHAYKMTETLITRHGEEKIKKIVLLLGEDIEFEEAFQEVFEKPYSELLTEIAAYEVEI